MEFEAYFLHKFKLSVREKGTSICPYQAKQVSLDNFIRNIFINEFNTSTLMIIFSALITFILDNSIEWCTDNFVFYQFISIFFTYIKLCMYTSILHPHLLDYIRMNNKSFEAHHIAMNQTEFVGTIFSQFEFIILLVYSINPLFERHIRNFGNKIEQIYKIIYMTNKRYMTSFFCQV